jgi:hypothetical protein
MKTKQEPIKSSSIVALCYISAMDLFEVMPSFSYKWAEDNPVLFNELLEQFGGDTTSFIEVQKDVIHRCRTGRLVTCDRYVLNERIDDEWVNSGYASREAKDKANGSRLLNDLYRMKGLS